MMAKTPENSATAKAKLMQPMKNLRLIASHLLRLGCFVVAFVVGEKICHSKISCPIGVFEVINRVFHRLWGTSTQHSQRFPTSRKRKWHFPFALWIFCGLSDGFSEKSCDLSTPLSTACGKLPLCLSNFGVKCRRFCPQPMTKPATFALFCRFKATNPCHRGSDFAHLGAF